MKTVTSRLFAVGLFMIAVSGAAMATSVPEIDPSLGVNVLALLGGAVLVIRSTRRK
jgi:hypothetical protein